MSIGSIDRSIHHRSIDEPERADPKDEPNQRTTTPNVTNRSTCTQARTVVDVRDDREVAHALLRNQPQPLLRSRHHLSNRALPPLLPPRRQWSPPPPAADGRRLGGSESKWKEVEEEEEGTYVRTGLDMAPYRPVRPTHPRWQQEHLRRGCWRPPPPHHSPPWKGHGGRGPVLLPPPVVVCGSNGRSAPGGYDTLSHYAHVDRCRRLVLQLLAAPIGGSLSRRWLDWIGLDWIV
jgi:hypothetical protein